MQGRSSFWQLAIRCFEVVKRILLTGVLGWALVTSWVAFPRDAHLTLPAPLSEVASGELSSSDPSPFRKDLATLVAAFRPQRHRSFCGPASLATVVRAYGHESADQVNLFPSWTNRIRVFYRGMTLSELAELGSSVGLQTEVVYANALTLSEFRERLRDNLATQGDYVLVNYDRRTLSQSGAGHISAVGAYDSSRDAFLILDQASYRYPYTWVPAGLLYQAIHTRDGDRFRGVLLVHSFSPSPG